jgi:FkbM family methyltransferase
MNPQQESIGKELGELLSESPSDAARRVAEQFRVAATDSLVLYGAGGLGATALAGLRKAGIEPAAFADDTPEKHGQVIDGLRVMTPVEAVEEFGERLVFAVTIMNPKLRFLDAQRRLRRLTDRPVVSFLHLAWQFPEVFLPYYQFVLPTDLLSKAEEIRKCFEVWADEESQRQFVAHLKFRLHLDFEALPANSGQGYFPLDVFPPLPDDTVFIDCGAFDGDTVRRFVEHQSDRFSRIYAFEPDEINCRRLQDYVTSLGELLASKVSVFNAGVGAARARVGFNATGNMSASFTKASDNQVEVLPLQEVVEVNGEFVFLKFDVEGAEWEALKGAEHLISQARPLLAISVYHRPDDLWELPLHIHWLNPDYRLFLRTQGEDGMDVICYAVPRMTLGSRTE